MVVLIQFCHATLVRGVVIRAHAADFDKVGVDAGTDTGRPGLRAFALIGSCVASSLQEVGIQITKHVVLGDRREPTDYVSPVRLRR